MAWTSPDPVVEPAESEEVSCQFEIIGENTLSFDVWVDLYDSRVVNHARSIGVFTYWRQLKIQNQRLRRGEKLNRRYTAPGRCKAKRTWRIQVRTGKEPKVVVRETSGTGSNSRTVDIGRSSRW